MMLEVNMIDKNWITGLHRIRI